MLVQIGNRTLELTNLDKVYWPNEGYTKAHLIQYYLEVAPHLLPHLRDRPLVLKRHPEGIEGKYFYQKECPDYAPEWLPRLGIATTGPSGAKKLVHFCLAPDLPSLIWIVNQGCMEMHPWLSTCQRPDHPSFAVIDLDPSATVGFGEVLVVARTLKATLDELGIVGYPKTSGATGLHVYIPLAERYTYTQVRQALRRLGELVVAKNSQYCTLERAVKKRGAKVYFDYLQNVRGKTIASVYSVRPLPGAPISVPVEWREIVEGQFVPSDFNLGNFRHQVPRRWQLFNHLLEKGAEQNLAPLLQLPKQTALG
ncbi:MAG: DNA polymerase domain-containing protein [Clostridia bacterium]|nr:DNA polymerase domain-containing protein [Clostridia bacterium]